MELEVVGATLRSYVSRSGVLHVVAATGHGLVGCDLTGVVTHQLTDADDPVVIDVSGAQAVDFDVELKQLPPFIADDARGEVSGPLGGLEHVAEGVLSLTRALGPPSVAIVWPRVTGDTELVVSGRDGEGVVVVIGDEQYEMDEGWPPQRPAP